MSKEIYFREYKPPCIFVVVCVRGGSLLIKNTTNENRIYFTLG